MLRVSLLGALLTYIIGFIIVYSGRVTPLPSIEGKNYKPSRFERAYIALYWPLIGISDLLLEVLRRK